MRVAIFVICLALLGCYKTAQQNKPPNTGVNWEKIESPIRGYPARRARVPEGWIVYVKHHNGVFVPDSEHQWLNPDLLQKPEKE